MTSWTLINDPDKLSDFVTEMAMRNVRQACYSFLIEDMTAQQCKVAVDFLGMCREKLNRLIDAEITKINQKSKEREGK